MTHLIPHVWVQDTGIGPKLYAGQIIDADGRQATHKIEHLGAYGGQISIRSPIRLAPLTPAGFDQLATQLADDIKAAAA
jgi:hypothetical protein